MYRTFPPTYRHRYGARFVTEYVDKTVGPKELCTGEYWVDLRWNGSNLELNQDEARQKLCDWINANGKRWVGGWFGRPARLLAVWARG